MFGNADKIANVRRMFFLNISLVFFKQSNNTWGACTTDEIRPLAVQRADALHNFPPYTHNTLRCQYNTNLFHIYLNHSDK
jgi:hypothetical protein